MALTSTILLSDVYYLTRVEVLQPFLIKHHTKRQQRSLPRSRCILVCMLFTQSFEYLTVHNTHARKRQMLCLLRVHILLNIYSKVSYTRTSLRVVIHLITIICLLGVYTGMIVHLQLGKVNIHQDENVWRVNSNTMF